MPPKLFVATKAFINHNGKILILRESSKYTDGSNQGKYDIVGGRLEPGQHFKDSLLREIREETGLEVIVGKPFFVGEWRPTVRGEKWQIVGVYFNCKTSSSEVILSGDHDEYKWIDPKAYTEYHLIDGLSAVFSAYLEK